MPASSSASFSFCPAGPTKGLPARSSLSPGCSPISITGAGTGPSPNTVCVAGSHSAQARQPRASFSGLLEGGDCGGLVRREVEAQLIGSSGHCDSFEAVLIQPIRGTS